MKVACMYQQMVELKYIQQMNTMLLELFGLKLVNKQVEDDNNKAEKLLQRV
jgi:hypothetical protein